MTQATLNDGTKVFCLRKPEAKMLDHHVDGYLQNGIKSMTETLSLTSVLMLVFSVLEPFKRQKMFTPIVLNPYQIYMRCLVRTLRNMEKV